MRNGQILLNYIVERESGSGVALTHKGMMRKPLTAHQFRPECAMADIWRIAKTLYAGSVTKEDANVVEHGCLLDKLQIKIENRTAERYLHSLVSHLTAVYRQYVPQLIVLWVIFVYNRLVVHVFSIILRKFADKISKLMSDSKTLTWVTDFLNTEILGVTLRDPIFFCLKAAVIYLFIRIVIWIIGISYRRNQQRTDRRKMDETNAKFFKRIATTFVYIIGVASILSLIPALEKIGTSILASAGILAMAVGLASQEALSNFVGGIFIILAKPFKLGDSIILDSGEAGTVMEITLRHTVLRNAENRMIIIPNSKINTATITNSNIGEQDTCALVEVGVGYSENLDRCIRVMREEVMKHPMLSDHRSAAEKENGTELVVIRVMALGDSSITLRAYAWAKTSGEAFVMKHDLLKSIKERFDAENIEIPFPYQNIVITPTGSLQS